MKKLMFTAAAALCATVGLCEGISSANVVGYAQNGVGKDEYSMLTPTFVDVAGKGLVLKDLAMASGNATALNFGNNVIYVFGNSGDPLLIMDDGVMEETFPEAYAEFGGEEDENGVEFTYIASTGHWYLMADDTYKYVMDDYPISDGMGLYLKASRTLGKGMSMTSSGQVATEDTEIPVGKDEYAMTGNSAPKDMTLSEFVIASGNSTALNFGNNVIYLFGNGGDPLLVMDDGVMEDLFPDAYAEFGAEEDENGVEFTFIQSTGHWYLMADDTYKYPMDNYLIAAGQGFYVKASRTLGKGLTFTIPPAIETAE